MEIFKNDMFLACVLLIAGAILYWLSNSIVGHVISDLRKKNESIEDMTNSYWMICWIISIIFMSFGTLYILSHII